MLILVTQGWSLIKSNFSRSSRTSTSNTWFQVCGLHIICTYGYSTSSFHSLYCAHWTDKWVVGNLIGVLAFARFWLVDSCQHIIPPRWRGVISLVGRYNRVIVVKFSVTHVGYVTLHPAPMIPVVVEVSYRVLRMMIIFHMCVKLTMLVMFGFCVYCSDICELCIYM